MITKTCTKCKLEKPISEFSLHKRYAEGIRSQCTECKNAEGRDYVRRNYARTMARTKAHAEAHPREYWAYSTMCAHRGNGYDVQISRKEVIDLAYLAKNCELCGIPLAWGKVGKHGHQIDDSPTLDRINNEKFLAVHNVQILCGRCNQTKSNKTMSEFISYCKMIAEKF